MPVNNCLIRFSIPWKKRNTANLVKETQGFIANSEYLVNDVLNGQKYWKIRERLGK